MEKAFPHVVHTYFFGRCPGEGTDTAEGDTTATALALEPGEVFTIAVAPMGCGRGGGHHHTMNEQVSGMFPTCFHVRIQIMYFMHFNLKFRYNATNFIM